MVTGIGCMPLTVNLSSHSEIIFRLSLWKRPRSVPIVSETQLSRVSHAGYFEFLLNISYWNRCSTIVHHVRVPDRRKLNSPKMERFLTNYSPAPKKQKTDISKAEKCQKYEISRVRAFLPK